VTLPRIRSVLLLVDYTGRLFRDAKAVISSELAGILNRLGSSAESCQARMRNCGKADCSADSSPPVDIAYAKSPHTSRCTTSQTSAGAQRMIAIRPTSASDDAEGYHGCRVCSRNTSRS
jgi:hypothetical protein